MTSLIKAPGKIGLFVVVSVVILFFLIIAFGREYIGNLQVEHEIAMLEQERERLEAQQLDALNLIDELSSEYYLEKEGRTKHGLAKDGETLVVVTQDEEQEADVEFLEEDSFAQMKNPQRWYIYFFDKVQFESLK
jgi:cell division protein FtsB